MACAVVPQVRLIREFLKPRDLIVPGTVLTVVMGYAAINLHGLPACNAKVRSNQTAMSCPQGMLVFLCPAPDHDRAQLTDHDFVNERRLRSRRLS